MDLNGRKCKTDGDCLSACINTLMNRDDCPYYFNNQNDADTAWFLLRAWMRQHGKDLMLFPYMDDPRPWMVSMSNETPYIMIYDNEDGAHAAIFKGGACIFDPAWVTKPVKGAVNGECWLVGVVVDYIS